MQGVMEAGLYHQAELVKQADAVKNVGTPQTQHSLPENQGSSTSLPKDGDFRHGHGCWDPRHRDPWHRPVPRPDPWHRPVPHPYPGPYIPWDPVRWWEHVDWDKNWPLHPDNPQDIPQDIIDYTIKR